MKTQSACTPRIDRIADAIAAASPRAAARAALVSEDGTALGYAELAQQIARVGRFFQDAGVNPGQRVALVGENSLDMIVGLFAATRAGAWAVPLNARMSPHEVDAILEHCRPRMVYFGGESPDAAAHAARRGALPVTGEPALPGHASLFCDDVAPQAVDADDVAVMIYTSGSTGKPKGVMLTHANLMFIARVSAKLGAQTPQDRVYFVLPLSHSYGLTSVLLCGLQSGATLYPVTRFSPEALARAVSVTGITVFQGVPAMYARLADWARANSATLVPNRLRLAYVGGSMLDTVRKQTTEKLLGTRLHHGYGLTEAAPSVTRTLGEDAPDDTTIGWPLPGVSVSLRARDGSEVADGEEGELCVRGPNVMLGYFRDAEQTRQAIDADGWLHTGDLARKGARDELYITGRIKELIVRNGFNVYPAEVENAIAAFPGVAQCAVVGITENGDETVAAYVEPQAGASIDIDGLLAFLRTRLAPYKVPGHIVCMERLPASSTGKLLKGRIKEIAADAAAGRNAMAGRRTD